MVGRLVALLGSTPRCQEPPLSCDNKKCLQTLPNVSWGAKLPLVKNHYNTEIFESHHLKGKL